jgi:hypothetical protein
MTTSPALKRRKAVLASFARWTAMTELSSEAAAEIEPILLKHLQREAAPRGGKLTEVLPAPLACSVLSFLDTASHVCVARCRRRSSI